MANVEQLLINLYGTAELPITVQKPWGHELVYAATDRYVGKILHINAGHQLSLQYHNRKQETNMLQHGRLVLIKGPNALGARLDGADIEARLRELEIGPGYCWTNLAGDVHTIRALEDSDVLEVSTPELDNVVRLIDRYKREGTTAP